MPGPDELQNDRVQQAIEATRQQVDQQFRNATAQRSRELGARTQEQQENPQEHRYYQKQETPMTVPMATEYNINTDLLRARPIVDVHESYHQRKKREEREKNTREALEKTRLANQVEGSDAVQNKRMGRTQAQVDELSREDTAQEQSVLKARLEAIRLNEKTALENAKADGELSEEKEWEIKRLALQDRAAAIDTMAKQLPMGSQERMEGLKEKEALLVQANELWQKIRIKAIADPAERRREEKTLSRHARYDSFKSLFRKETQFSREEAVYVQPQSTYTDGAHAGEQRTYVNKGRAFFGGTKFMYIMENQQERNQQGAPQQYLYKEATNCVGQHKPSGALVTEAASQLQHFVCGPAYSIPAWAVRDDTGKVVGSMQKKIDRVDRPVDRPADSPVETPVERPVDLFSWQVKADQELPEETKADLLREHTLDWVLCNFDTKGENFLMQANNRLISFDKEASFNHLNDEGAQHMSTDYKPHANDTIYNTLFKAFIAGTVTLDLSKSLEHVQKMESMSNEELTAIFGETLTQRYGEGTAARQEAERKLLQRKNELRAEYRRFYTDLIEKRQTAMAGKDDPMDYSGLLDAEGKFRFSDEGAQ